MSKHDSMLTSRDSVASALRRKVAAAVNLWIASRSLPPEGGSHAVARTQRETRTQVDYQLRGMTAYVSAGAHGIGEAIADLLASEGADVLVSDHDGIVLREKAHKWRGTITADLATGDGVQHAVETVLSTFGKAPDIVINNL